MIAKASAIQHGQAMTNYATKNNRADIVKTNHLSEGLPPMGMWDEMVLHQSMFKQRYAKKPIELTSIRFELSPSEEEARNWTMEDWRRFLDEFIREMDGISKVNHIGKKKGKAATSVKPTNIANSQYFAALHRDSCGTVHGIRSLIVLGTPVRAREQSVALPPQTIYARLALKLFRREPAITEFDWPFTPIHSSSKHFST